MSVLLKMVLKEADYDSISAKQLRVEDALLLHAEQLTVDQTIELRKVQVLRDLVGALENWQMETAEKLAK